MDKLDTFDMNHNQLTRIDAGSFEGMPRLTSLSLDYNKISNINSEGFRGLEGMTAILLHSETKYFFRESAVSLHHSQQTQLFSVWCTSTTSPTHNPPPRR